MFRRQNGLGGNYNNQLISTNGNENIPIGRLDGSGRGIGMPGGMRRNNYNNQLIPTNGNENIPVGRLDGSGKGVGMPNGMRRNQSKICRRTGK